MRVTVCVATFGDDKWRETAKTAVESAKAQTVRPEVVTAHAATLAKARNSCSELASSEWLVFLDADDTLDENYVEKMLEAVDIYGEGYLFQPQTLGVYPDGSTDPEPQFIRASKTLLERNHLIIGTMVERDLFIKVGGFRELPALEDWDLWLRCWINGGATWVQAPGAVYRITVNPNGRNQTQPNGVYGQIRMQYSRLAAERGLT